MAEKQSSSYRSEVVSAAVRTIETQPEYGATCEMSNEVTAAAGFAEEKCYFCGYKKHPRLKCPAKEAICKKCSKVGHFAKVCRSTSTEKSHKTAMALSEGPNLASISAAGVGIAGLKKAQIIVSVKGKKLNALVDTFRHC